MKRRLLRYAHGAPSDPDPGEAAERASTGAREQLAPGCLAWATDVHFDCATPSCMDALARDLLASRPRAALLTGDLSNGTRLRTDLLALAARMEGVPLYVVLGNHDFYGASVPASRAAVRALPGVTHLPAAGPVEFAEGVVLVGVDGWADAQLGDPSACAVTLGDFHYIAELRPAFARDPRRRAELHRLLRDLGRREAERLRELLVQALRTGPRRVLVATHVPPFAGAAWHEGEVSGPTWLPYFTCKATGDVLLAAAADYPAVAFEVYCGHSHSPGVYRPRPNLRVATGAAEYGAPRALEPIPL